MLKILTCYDNNKTKSCYFCSPTAQYSAENTASPSNFKQECELWSHYFWGLFLSLFVDQQEKIKFQEDYEHASWMVNDMIIK